MNNWEILGFALMALAVLQLLWLLAVQFLGDIREAALQARVKRAKKPSVGLTAVVLAGADTQAADALDGLTADNVAAQVLWYAPARSKAYNQARYYRTKHRLGVRLQVIVRPSADKLIQSLYTRSSGTNLVIIDGSVQADQQTLQRIADIMAVRKVQALSLRPRIRVDSTLASGLLAAWQVFARHLGRVYRSVPAPTHGLAVQKSALRNLARRKRGVSTETVRDIWAVLPETTRRAAVAPRNTVIEGRTAVSWRQLIALHVPPARILPAFIGPAAIAAAVAILGSFQGMVVLGFVAMLLMFLAALAIWSEPKLNMVARINTLLLTPFAYVWYVIMAVLSTVRLPLYLLRR